MLSSDQFIGNNNDLVIILHSDCLLIQFLLGRDIVMDMHISAYMALSTQEYFLLQRKETTIYTCLRSYHS